MQIAEATSQKIKNMGLLCAVYVVAIHAWTLGDCKNWLLHQHVIQGITRIAVPFFFAVSGFFLARYIGEDGRSFVAAEYQWNKVAENLMTAYQLGINANG